MAGTQVHDGDGNRNSIGMYKWDAAPDIEKNRVHNHVAIQSMCCRSCWTRWFQCLSI